MTQKMITDFSQLISKSIVTEREPLAAGGIDDGLKSGAIVNAQLTGQLASRLKAVEDKFKKEPVSK